jgi:hypothetical protein
MSSGAPVAGEDGNWSCFECKNVNFSHRDRCNRCGVARPADSGNWICPKCQNVNYPHRMKCNRCEFPRPQAGGGGSRGMGAPAYSPYGAQYGTQQDTLGQQRGTGYGSGSVGGDQYGSSGAGYGAVYNQQQQMGGNQDIMLSTQKYVSLFSTEYDPVDAAIKCIMRVYGRDSIPQQQQQQQRSFGGGYGSGMGGSNKRMRSEGAPRAGEGGNWLCESCGNINFPFRTVCNRCQNPRPESKDGGSGGGGKDGENWVCPVETCGNVNFPFRTHCNRCSLERPTSASS